MVDLNNNNNNNNNGSCGWSSLPSDLLATIANDLLPFPDYIRFRSVCKSWRDSVPAVAMPPLLLLLPGNGHGQDYGELTADSLTFCSPASLHTTFQLPTPPGFAGNHCVGSHDGWLAMCGPTLEFFLFNPFTAERIDLPHNGYRLKKIVFNSSPTAENLMAIGVDDYGCISYTRAGEGEWTFIEDDVDDDEDDRFRIPIEDVIFLDGRFWAINSHGLLFIFDLRGKGYPNPLASFSIYRSGCLTRTIVPEPADLYLAAGNAGNIVVVLRYRDEDQTKFHTRRVVLVEFVGPEFDRAHRVRSLGGLSLFIGNNNCFSLPVEEGLKLRGNCVFLTGISHDKSCRVWEQDMGVFDRGNGSFELMFPQCMEFNWCQPKPIWFMPSMKRNNLVHA